MEACKTVSACTAGAAQGTHVFDILGYSKLRGMGDEPESFILSGIFTVGDHDWAIRFYPDGFQKESEVHKTEPRIFNSDDTTKFAPQTSQFKRRSDIEGSAYLRDDHLKIECIITVFEKPHVTDTKLGLRKIDMPPSDMTEHVGRLLEEKEGFDVSFSVGGETIEAHRLVLAMRSPVLKAELYGPMREAKLRQCITIKDMQHAVFRALLHFIYTDSLPGGEDEDTEMAQLLLMAADRYAMERLKLVCQSILCKDLNVDTVATTLALADQHNCDELKDACLEFIEISDTNAMDAVVATQGFKDLKVTCPSLIVDALEKRRKFRKA
ncbi:BTB/POZ and MATH domain-containing protein 2 [Triticum urartu]|uniref:BTB/POZ and MATH domain-containing protein 2 n=1 Tax=Triticum urartu TaxID=4572 RepID=M7Z5U1_TRIUA|nr:BTB/POZ and MATH domain-containing protein 2 [Triticum urartu]